MSCKHLYFYGMDESKKKTTKKQTKKPRTLEKKLFSVHLHKPWVCYSFYSKLLATEDEIYVF